jgi:16S rRNA processing protein RimM
MIAVGRIAKSVGLKGELGISMLTDDPLRFAKLKSVWIGKEESKAVQYAVASARTTTSAVVLKLVGIDSRTTADGQRGQLVFVSTKDAISPRKGSYFIHDIVGINVVTEAGDEVGTVQEVMKLPANDVWVVSKGEKEILIPAIKEVIRSVDVKRRTVVIRPLEGLLE